MAYSCVKGIKEECDGCMECKEEIFFYCPVCGEMVLETVFVSNNGEIIGCENCAEIKEPWEMQKDED